MIKTATITVAFCALLGFAGLSAAATDVTDTYSASVSMVAFDGPLDPNFFRGKNRFAFDDAADGDGPVVGSSAVLPDAGGTPLFNSRVFVTDLGDGTLSVTATLSAIAGSLLDSIPQAAMKINSDGGALTANAFNYTVGNILGLPPEIRRDGINIGTEWVFIDGEVRLSGMNPDEVIDHVQLFHPSDVEGAALTDVHLGYNLDMETLERTKASSMSITVKVRPLQTR
jgi:hypothetical protein